MKKELIERYELTPRLVRLAQCLEVGMTNTQIAAYFDINRSAVQKGMRVLADRLGIPNGGKNIRLRGAIRRELFPELYPGWWTEP